MAVVNARDAENALRRLDASVLVVLVYGPDDGLVAERARKVAAASVADPADPFQLVRLDGDAVASDPGRLADEAGTIGLFGAKRAIWIRPTSRNLAPAVQAVLEMAPVEVRIVVEAGDLAKTSPVRTLCEKAPRALAIPCYADTEGDLTALVDATLKAAGHSIDRDARALLLAGLGGNRLASRGELEKLLLFVHGQTEIGVADVAAALSDVSAHALDDVVDAAFAGRLSDADTALRRALREGTHPSVVLGALLRHGLQLLPARADVEGGRSTDSVVEAWRGLFFRRKAIVKVQLGAWRLSLLREAVDILQRAILATRQAPDLADAAAAQAVMAIAVRARGRGNA
ncbi:DNA polymerase III subunit delta [Salinarimonas soli]|uniref:DNA-directed DNA polymerase n=1 Tax=Salinarimonas soli TaxID=1638099 RepID=A0A5B2VH84_9HYPH|nr:DNA polymerase III subunit delta [Salinarimonas soli]KAA2237840.1 DNA polymerase III subunit delta [Salinarimonas soli]